MSGETTLCDACGNEREVADTLGCECGMTICYDCDISHECEAADDPSEEGAGDAE